MSTPTLYANTDLVAVSWLAGVPGLAAGMVATTLPGPTSWEATGFVTVRASGGGEAVDYPLHSPVVTVDCWGYKSGSAKPPWNQANNLAMAIVSACHDNAHPARDVTLPGTYPTARVTGVWVAQLPRRSYGEPGNFAHYVLDVGFSWVQLP